MSDPPVGTFFVARDGQAVGEYRTEHQFREKILAGEVRPDDFYWTDGMADWLPVSQFPMTARKPVMPPPPLPMKPQAAARPRSAPSGGSIAMRAIGGTVLGIVMIIAMVRCGEDMEKARVHNAEKAEQQAASRDRENDELAAKGRVRVGMTAEQCLTAWGKPEKVNTTINAQGRHEQWCYASGSYLYVDNGVLRSIQK